MDAIDRQELIHERNDTELLEQVLNSSAPSLDQVSAFAGDRTLTEPEKCFFEELKQKRGEQFFPDLLYTVTHQIFPSATAGDLWRAILRHKYAMSEALKRNVRITVAALDYLTNLKGELPAATVISEMHMTKMVRLSMRDGLTHLFNHASFFQKLKLELRCHALCRQIVSLMLVDVDGFKAINDRFGHHAGDLVLIDLAALMESTVRAADMCCRYGGDEFAVIMPKTEAAEAGMLAERLQVKLSHSRPDGQVVTVSIGVAACGENALTSLALVEKADAALYEAKKRGKNCIVVNSL